MPSTAHANPIMAYSLPFHQQPTPSNRKYLHLETKSCLSENCPFRILPQLSNLGWVSNSVSNKVSCPVVRTGWPIKMIFSMPNNQCVTVSFKSTLLKIRIKLDKHWTTVQENPSRNSCIGVGYCWVRFDKPVLITEPKPLLIEFGIHHRLESCVTLYFYPLLQLISIGQPFVAPE